MATSVTLDLMFNMQPKIGILGQFFEENGSIIYGIGDNYRKAVIENGGIPIIISPPKTDIDYYYTKNRNIPSLSDLDKRLLDLEMLSLS